MRRAIIGTLAMGLVATAALVAPAASAAEKVNIAIIGGAADVGFYLADAKGWFAEEGIEVDMVPFDSGARMIAPMSMGEIDVGTGAVTAGLYNAVERDISLRIVADKGRNVRGMSFQGMMVRTALMDSGEVKKFVDLKGRKFAFTGPGANDSAVIDDALRAAGSNISEVGVVNLGLPIQIAAYQNGAIDASIMPEPFRSNAIKLGAARELMGVADLRDNDQTGCVVYAGGFIQKRPEVARKLMKAYIRGVRYYADSLKDGAIAGPHADELIDAIAKYSTLKDKNVLRSIVPTAIDPNGQVSVDSLRKDLAFYKAQGLLKSDITVDQVLDNSWVADAVKELGPYSPK